MTQFLKDTWLRAAQLGFPITGLAVHQPTGAAPYSGGGGAGGGCGGCGGGGGGGGGGALAGNMFVAGWRQYTTATPPLRAYAGPIMSTQPPVIMMKHVSIEGTK